MVNRCAVAIRKHSRRDTLADHSDYLKLWGKTDRSPNGDPSNYHPLLFHLYDVAFCAGILWDRLPDALQLRISTALNLNTIQARAVVILLAGLHDIGKAYPGFQMKGKFQIGGLVDAGYDFPNDMNNSPPHNYVSVAEAKRLLTDINYIELAFQPHIAKLLASILGAHHGIFPNSTDLNAIKKRMLGEKPIWRDARRWLAEQLIQLCPEVKEISLDSLGNIEDHGFAPLLAALISLADWFGSSKFFQMKGTQEIDQYKEKSFRTAFDAIEYSGWTAPPTAKQPMDFATIFQYLNPEGVINPNPLQRTVLSLLKDVSSPSLWIIEEEMGAGKTEAAFSIFDHAKTNNLAHGLYIAMPTQATSNAMFGRLGDFLQHRNPEETINLILAHSHALLDEEYLQRMEKANQFTSEIYDDLNNTRMKSSEQASTLLVREWFTLSKQTLLAYYGVGTIDQALLGVLTTKHWFVRLFGLAHKVVIFDEVHAYDAYMNTLLEKLIKWLAEMDCTVILLSATLPSATRLSLTEAYSKGAKKYLQTLEDVKYPRITLCLKEDIVGIRTVNIENDQQEPVKIVHILHIDNTPSAILSSISSALPNGGCVIIICNTVATAQHMFRDIRMQLEPEGWECHLFHAMTPFVWRKEKEEQVLELFGKHSGVERTEPRGKTLLVATQVVEQSLDLDADYMISQIAPIDLILQRLGRLHRHRRARSSPIPCFGLLKDVDEPKAVPNFGSSEFIYHRYILLRSWLVLKERTKFELPNDIDSLVNAVYDKPYHENLPQSLLDALVDSKQLMTAEQKEQMEHANRVSVTPQRGEQDYWEWLDEMKPYLLDDEDPKIHQALKALTRDGDPSLTIVCCGTDEFGLPLAELPRGFISSETTRQMMRFSLPISKKALYHALKDTKPPDNWRNNSYLRYCRCVVFDHGSSEIKNIHLTLSKQTGLQINVIN